MRRWGQRRCWEADRGTIRTLGGVLRLDGWGRRIRVDASPPADSPTAFATIVQVLTARCRPDVMSLAGMSLIEPLCCSCGPIATPSGRWQACARTNGPHGGEHASRERLLRGLLSADRAAHAAGDLRLPGLAAVRLHSLKVRGVESPSAQPPRKRNAATFDDRVAALRFILDRSLRGAARPPLHG